MWLVTGGLGFIGASVARAVALAGQAVRVVDASLAGHGANTRNLEGLDGELEVRALDIRDTDALAAAMRGATVVVHAAGHVSHTAGLRDPSLDLEHNVRGTLSVLEAIRRAAPSARLLFTSTRGVYGRAAAIPVGEDAPLAPAGVHEWSKLAAEQLCDTYARLHGLDVVVARLSNVYGPRAQVRSPEYNVLSWFVKLALDDAPIRLFGGGAQRRDVLYIDDAVEALLLLARKAPVHGANGARIYNVGSEQPHSLREIALAIVQEAGTGRVEDAEYSEDRKRLEIGDFAASVKKLHAETGWEVRVDLREGMAQTIGYYRANREAYW